MSPAVHQHEPSSALTEANTATFEHLIRTHLTDFSEVLESATKSELLKSERQIQHLGDYLVRLAQIWAQLTEDLVSCPQISQEITSVHQRAEVISHLADLSSVVSMDIEISKLRYAVPQNITCIESDRNFVREIQRLTEQFSRDIKTTWDS